MAVSTSTAPKPNESQADFAVRFHAATKSEIPKTSERERACVEAWRTSGKDDLDRVAQSHFAADQFRHVQNIPVWAEHETTREKDGKEEQVKYELAELKAVLDRCNHRIEDTGNFPTISHGHTPDHDALDRGARMPEALGFAGPFRLGMIGDKRPRWAIFADEWHRKDCTDQLDRMRYRSPEVWVDDDVSKRFMDPIAALETETPRLDLGMARYRRAGDGQLVQRYAATFAGAGNVFIPGEEPDRHQKPTEESSDMDDSTVKSIIDALMETREFQFLHQMMQSEESQQPEGDGNMPAELETEETEEPTVDNYECDDDDNEMFAKYMAGDASDQDVMDYRAGKRAKYEADDESDDDETDDYEADDDTENYEADDEDAEDYWKGANQGGQKKAMWAQVPGEKRKKLKGGKKGEYSDMDSEWSKNSKTSGGDKAMKYQREREIQQARDFENREKYAKLEARLIKAESELTTARQERSKTDRYSKLQGLRQQFAFDLEDAVKDFADPTAISDKEFARHCATIEKYSARIGTADKIPRLFAPDITPQGDGDTAAIAKAAQAEVLAERRAGRNANYKDVYSRLAAERGDKKSKSASA